jgi:hypothetical protein
VKVCTVKMMLATWGAIGVATGATLVVLTLAESSGQGISEAAGDRAIGLFVAWFTATFTGGATATLAVWAVKARAARRRSKGRGGV